MKKYILIIAVFFSIGISGCKKDYLSLEQNPNQPSVSPPGITLAGALAVAANTINTAYAQDGVWVQYFSRSGSYVPNTSLDEFQITNTSFTGVWTTLYQNLTNFNNLQVSAAKDASQANYQAIAMIMKVYDFQQLVDNFGDVPYSQAFQPSTILFPAYDKQKDIYADLGKQLDAAIGLINKSGGATDPGTADIVFGGDMTGWKKFANSLKLRLAIRVSTVSPSDPLITALASTSSEGYLDGDTQALANPGYANTLSGSASQQSPFYAAYGFDVTGNATFFNNYYRGNTYFINKLTDFNDPRLAKVYDVNNNGVIDGNPFGIATNAKSNAATSPPGPGLLKSPTMDAVLFSGAESLFLQAEALQKGFSIGGSLSAQQAYEAGVTASFVAMGLTAAQATTYYGQAIPNVGFASSNKLEAIAYQKWISLIGYNNLEGYLEYLRTGYPILPSPVSQDPNAVSATLPIRQYYPLSEVTSNPTQVGKEPTIDIFKTKLFWEQ